MDAGKGLKELEGQQIGLDNKRRKETIVSSSISLNTIGSVELKELADKEAEEVWVDIEGNTASPSSEPGQSADVEVVAKISEEKGKNYVDEQSQPNITKATYLSFATLCVISLVEALDATSIAVVLPTIATSIKASTTVTFILATSFLLCATIFQPFFHALSVSFGRKPVLLVSLILFLIGAITGGWATNIKTLLAGRVIQGIGAAGSITLTVVVVADLVSLRKRAPWLAGLNVMWAVGSVSGPIIGGAFVNVNWRWIFWLNIPLVVASFVGIVIFLRLKLPSISLRNKLSSIDYAGTALFLISSTAFLLPIMLAGTIAPWVSFRILVPFFLGFLGLIVFVLYQKYLTSAKSNTKPLIPVSIFSNRTTIIGHSETFTHGILLWLILYYLPLYYEGVLGYSPLQAGLSGLPETLTVAPAAIAVGLAISKSNSYIWILRFGWLLTALGMGLLCILNSATSRGVWIVVNLIPGIALGILIPATAIAIQAATDPRDIGSAISMFYMIRGCGQTAGVAIGSTIFRYQLKEVLGAEVGTNGTVEGLLKILRGLRQGGADSTILIDGIVKALQIVWAVGCGLAGAAAFGSFWMKEYSLDNSNKTQETG